MYFFFIVAQRSSRCPYTLLLIGLPTPVLKDYDHTCGAHGLVFKTILITFMSPHRGRGRMVVRFTTISAYRHSRREFSPRSWRGVHDTTL
jgi:hypothetical protein